MTESKTILSNQEKKWLSEQKILRITDDKEVLIYPMGAERYLSSALFEPKKNQYNIRQHIEGKDILVIPGYGNTSFLFAQAGAKSVTVYDKDPLTIAWVKAFKKYYHYREHSVQGIPFPSIGEILTALTRWYPPLITLPSQRSTSSRRRRDLPSVSTMPNHGDPSFGMTASLLMFPKGLGYSGRFRNGISWLLNPKSLRRTYIYYMLSLVQKAIKSKSTEDYELDKKIQFHAGELKQLIKKEDKRVFDTAFVPYLLGVKNGIEKVEDIVTFIQQIITLVPNGSVLISPARDMKELVIMGQRYFVTTGYPSINTLPNLQQYFKEEDSNWFRSQGLAIFSQHSPNNSNE